MKREYLEQLKTLILEEEDKRPMFSLNSPTSSLTNIYKHFPIPNPFQQITTKKNCKQKLMNSKLRFGI